MSRYELARESDVSEAVLCRFVNGKAGLSMESLDKVADVLGLEVVARDRKGQFVVATGHASLRADENAMPATSSGSKARPSRLWFDLGEEDEAQRREAED
jgi:hypothetical protein